MATPCIGQAHGTVFLVEQRILRLKRAVSELLKNLRPAVVVQGPVVLPTGSAGRE